MVTGLFVFFAATTLLYGCFLLWLWFGLNRNKRSGSSTIRPMVSVIIPARNEETTIARCLADLDAQSYPAGRYEVLVVDDGSDDSTAAIVQSNGRVRYLALAPLPPGWSPKKAALRHGILHSHGEVILTTDADSRIPPTWIEEMVSHLHPDTAAVASWVVLPPSDRLLTRLEMLDMLSLQTVGAAAMGHGVPFLANGANWGYRRSTFEAVQGFSGHETIASGDDDLLLQKFLRHGRFSCAFVNHSNSCVTTTPCRGWREFFMQRLRWASKTALYPWPVRWLELAVFLYYVSLLVLLLLVPFYPSLLVIIIGKYLCDLALIRHVGQNLAMQVRWYDILLASWWQILYMTAIALVAWRGRFVWKGREYKRGRLLRQEKDLKRTR